MADKNKILSDLKDLILTLRNNKELFNSNTGFRAKWVQKNKELHEAVKQLTPEEYKEIESEYLEWMRRELPEISEMSECKSKNPPKNLPLFT